MLPGVLGRLGVSGERLKRLGRLLGRLGAVLVAFRAVLDVERVQDTKSQKNNNFKIFGSAPRRLGSVLERPVRILGRQDSLQGRFGRQDEL